MSCPEDRRRVIFYDKKTPKLACLVSKTGIKTFSLHTYDRTRKKAIQFTIGRYPEVTINKARDIATKLLAQLTEGVDIIEAQRKIREEPTLNELYNRWYLAAKDRKKTIHDDKRTYELHIKPTFGSRQIMTITTTQINSWHKNLPKKTRQRKKDGKQTTLSPTSANRCLALLRTIINQEASEMYNPCTGVKFFKEVSRNRFLKPFELKRFFDALHSEETPKELRDLIYILLFTGARRSNAFSMKWNEINFEDALWTIPATKSKSGEKMEIPLVQEVINVLKERKEAASSIFVFPARSKSGHISDPKKQWQKLREKTGLLDIRLHDLRRTCGSYQARIGSNLITIGQSLGHKNISTTQIYARIDTDPVRKSMELGAEEMLKAATGQSKVVNIGEDNE